MMRFIQKWSYSCANYLMNQMGENHQKRSVYYYGFQIIIGAVVKGVLLVSIALLFRSLIPTLIAVLTFSSLRVIAGGYHMDTYGKCISLSLAMFIVAGIVVQYTHLHWNIYYTITLVVLSFITALFVLIKWAPADTPNKPITDPKEIKKFKSLSIIYALVWLVLQSVFIYKGLKMFAIASCFGLLLELYTVTPNGHNFFDRISGQVDTIKG